jgi:DNA-binding XRE family transcriptional regulator
MANPLRPIMIERRAQLGLRQEDAAAKVPCSPNTWGRWESAHRLPHARVWLKIAKVLGLTLAQLQRAASSAWRDLDGGQVTQPDPKGGEGKPTDPDRYEFLSIEAQILDRTVTNIDLHKLAQAGWQYTMEQWRSTLREQFRAIDLQVRAARNQAEFYQKMHAHLLGNETGRVYPLPKPIKMTGPPPPKRGKPKGGGPKGKKKR